MHGSGNGWLLFLVGAAMLGAVMSAPASKDGRTEIDPSSGGSAAALAAGNGDGASDTSESVFGGDAVVLQRSNDGHFYAEPQINGQTIRMLVDTGATAIALARDDARRAGVGISIGMPQVVGQGASGDVHGEVVSLDRIVLGATEAENMRALVLDEGQMSLLGQSFLSRFDSVEIKGDRMVLR